MGGVVDADGRLVLLGRVKNVHLSGVVGVYHVRFRGRRNNVHCCDVVFATVVAEGVEEGGKQRAEDAILDFEAGWRHLVLDFHPLKHAHYQENDCIAVKLVAGRPSEFHFVEEGPHHEENRL